MTARGRPKKEDAKRGQYRLRMSEEEEAVLDYVSRELHKSKAETVRFCVKIVHDSLKGQH